MKKSVHFPWRPIAIFKPDCDHRRISRLTKSLITPLYRDVSDYSRPTVKYYGHRQQLKTKAMENRIVSNVLQKNSDFLSRHLVLSPTVLEKLQENGLISEYVKRQLAVSGKIITYNQPKSDSVKYIIFFKLL